MGESRMIFPQFTPWISSLIATGSLLQATVAAAEDGQLAFNNVCRMECAPRAGQFHAVVLTVCRA
jgi:hypothetical protein